MLGSASAQEGTEFVENMLLVGQLPFFREIPCGTKGGTTRHDSNFDQRVRPTEHPRDSGMPCFVVGDRAFFVLGKDFRFALQTADDTVDGIHKVLFANFLMVVASSDEGSLVAYIGNVCARETGCLLSQEVHIEGIVCLNRAEMHLEYLFALLQVGEFDMYLPVEPPGTQQSGIQDIGPVGSREDDDPRVGTETVHLGKQLVERRFTFIVAPCHHILAPRTTDSIDLVNKDDGRCFLLGLAE